ncbi:MAG: small subunit ribosomal protein [Thermoleophilaceae bacterium]|jgi:small subunit ribosomal protein S16|nr:small subunit ribosomal protein [Thermoleophilaceae bacterium]
MSVRVRLTRVGSKKNPIWRVVVSDQRSPRDGRFIETIGHYNPQTDPSTIVIDTDRFQHWVSRGAQPTNTVKQLVRAHAKGVAGGTSTGSAGVSKAPVAVAEPEAAPTDAEPDADETPAAEAPAGEAPADEPEAADAEAAAADAADPDSAE